MQNTGHGDGGVSPKGTSVDTVIVARQVQRCLASHSLCRRFLSLGPVHFLLSQFSALRNLWGHVPPAPTSEAKLGWVIKEIAASSKHELPKVVSFQHVLIHDDLRFVLLMMKRYWTKPWEICHCKQSKQSEGEGFLIYSFSHLPVLWVLASPHPLTHAVTGTHLSSASRYWGLRSPFLPRLFSGLSHALFGTWGYVSPPLP